MSRYERHVLQGVLAGLTTGLLLGVVVVVLISISYFEDIVLELTRDILPRDLSASEIEEIVENTKRTMRAVYWIIPVSSIVQYLLIGALFGLVKGWLAERQRLDELKSALLASVLYLALVCGVPFIILSSLVDLFEHPFMLVLIVFPGVTYTVLLTVFSTKRGPWSKIIDAKPKEV